MSLIPNTTLSLAKKETAWFVEKGSVNLFAIKKSTDAKGTRHNIATLTGPTYLFSVEDQSDDFEVVAITETESTVQEVPFAEVKNLPGHINDWIHTLSLFQKKEPEQAISYILPEEGEASLNKQTLFEAARRFKREKDQILNWIILQTGKVHLFQYSDPATIQEEDVYPMAQNIWMRAAADSKLVVATTEEIINKGLITKGLKKFHDIFFLYLRFNDQQLEKEDVHRLLIRKRKEAEDLDEIFKSMNFLLNPVEAIPLVSEGALFKACQYLGKKQNIEIIYPEHTIDGKNPALLIQDICEASQIRFRAVTLDGNWWKEESGPLLGFYGPQHRPVVLLSSSSSHYEMIDPATGQKTKITDKIAPHFSHFAYCFYRPFPDDLKTGKEVLKWYLEKHDQEFIPLLVYGVLAALIGLFPSIIAALLFNIIIPNVMIPLLDDVAIGLAVATITSSLFFLFRSLILVRIQGIASHEIWAAFWDRLLKLSPRFFHRFSSGNLYNMISSLDEIRLQLGANGARAILSGFFSFFYFLMMALYSTRLTLVPFFLVLLTSLITFTAIHYKVPLLKKTLNLKGKINGAVVQMLGAVSKFRIFGSETEGFAYWGSQFIEAKKLEMKAQRIQNIVIISNAILTFLGPAILFGYAIILSQQKLIPTWVFLAFNSAFFPFIYSLFDLSNTLIEISNISALWQRAKLVLEEPLEMTKKKEYPGKLSGTISVDRVCFRYGDTMPMILKNLSLEIRPKEFVAIVGASGSGKSTLLRLLLGFIQAHSGGIYFDGKELSQLNFQAIRKQIGVVLQESGFINGSIFDNITCGGIYSIEDVESALALSGFDEELEKFPMGLNTAISAGSSTFSGGQKQKILIARALIGRPKILIFDEATSFLDNHAQDRISRNIENLEITRIVSAHRLSTIRRADRIYVIEQGTVVQTGTFDMLSQEAGLFKRMLERQQI